MGGFLHNRKGGSAVAVIITPADGQIIEDMPFDEYTDIDALNQSGLKLLDISPGHYKYAPKKDTKSLRIGSAINCYLLEPDKVGEQIAVLPNAVEMGKKSFYQTNDGKEFKKRFLEDNKDKVVLSYKESIDVGHMVSSVKSNEHYTKLLALPHKREVTILFKLRDIDCKARLDLWFHEDQMIADIKTTKSCLAGSFSGGIYEYGYHTQAWWYQKALEACGLTVDCYALLALENTPYFDNHYLSKLYQLYERAIHVGGLKVDRLLDLYATCLELDDWPFYDQPEMIDLPHYAYTALQREAREGAEYD